MRFRYAQLQQSRTCPKQGPLLLFLQNGAPHRFWGSEDERWLLGFCQEWRKIIHHEPTPNLRKSLKIWRHSSTYLHHYCSSISLFCGFERCHLLYCLFFRFISFCSAAHLMKWTSSKTDNQLAKKLLESYKQKFRRNIQPASDIDNQVYDLQAVLERATKRRTKGYLKIQMRSGWLTSKEKNKKPPDWN